MFLFVFEKKKFILFLRKKGSIIEEIHHEIMSFSQIAKRGVSDHVIDDYYILRTHPYFTMVLE